MRAFNRLLSIITLGRVGGVSSKSDNANLTGLADDEVVVLQPYGYQSRPQEGSTAVLAALGSDSTERIAIVIGDARYNIDLEPGEVCISDDLGQKIHLTRTGIVVKADHVTVDSGSIDLGANAQLGVARQTDTTQLDADFAVWAAEVTSFVGAAIFPTPLVSPTGKGFIASSSTNTRSL